ncbi:MAG: hypothetical protein LIP01_05475 [Tannerellaceae bacterium]|nr:hypothetical protein [Tannerellaceae bacterium]
MVGFLTGIEGQFQEGYINITVYIPDVLAGDSKKVKDIARCEIIEGCLSEWFGLLNPDGEYLFSLANTIHTIPVPDISQHAVCVKLHYKRINF